MKLAAKWTDDCGGKKDYDGDLLSISTRYWPADGGFYVLRGSEFKKNDVLQKPSAKCSLLFWDGEHGAREDTGGDFIDVIERTFEGDTFDEVREQVEAWAQQITDRVVAAIQREFSRPDGGSIPPQGKD